MQNKGFTLIELVVTISIIFIVLASAALVIDMDMFYLEKMADEFAMDVRYVQIQSVKDENASYRVSIDADKGYYKILNFSVVEKTVKFKDRYQIGYSNHESSVGFTHNGTPINSGTFTILDTRTNKTKQISIVPTTGRTLIKE